MKGTNKDFYNLDPNCMRRELSPNTYAQVAGRNCVQITCNTSGAHHVQHVCHVERRDGSAAKFDIV